MAKHFQENSNYPKYGEIVRHHSTAKRAIEEYFETSSDHLGTPQTELKFLKLIAIAHQEKQDMLTLLAFLETCFRVDFLLRKELNLKDQLSKDLIRTFNRKNQRASLERDIVKNWLKREQISHATYNRILLALQFRHWLAHGQYWDSSALKIYDFYDLAQFIEALVQECSFKTLMDVQV